MSKELAVAVIHGIGSQGAKRPQNSDEPTFSKELQKRVYSKLGNVKSSKIAWREIFWADILQSRQDTYLRKIKRKTRFDELREFVLCNLSDASAYRFNPNDANDDTYSLIHNRVFQTISELENDVSKGAPLIVLAHSMGGHIMSNYIYDATKKSDDDCSTFCRLKTMAGFVTFGCNIPLFTFSYAPEHVTPIAFPGTELSKAKQVKPWWLNFYDKDDVLGFPLAEIGPRYKAMADAKELREKAINAGSWLSSWNPASHNAYWRDDDFYIPVSNFIKKFI